MNKQSIEEYKRRNRMLERYGYKDYQDFLNSPFWKAMKEDLKKRDFYKKCHCCGEEGNMELHHIKYKNFLDGASKKNIFPLCRKCHQQTHDISWEQKITFKQAMRKIRRAHKYKPQQRKRETKYVVVGEGEPCPKCHNIMQRRSHREVPDHPHFEKWDYCKPCRHVQHYQEYRQW